METSAALVFDGDCAWCRALAAWARTRMRAGVELVDARSWQQRSARPSAVELATSVWWLEGDQHWSGAAAVARALRTLGRPWRAIGVVLDWPAVRPVVGAGYRFIARHRCARGCATDRSGEARRTMSPWST